MPELPEVETTRSGIAPYVEGEVVSKVLVRNGRLRYIVPKALAKMPVGQVVRRVDRRGKYLLFCLDGGTIMVHLGMSGSLCVVDEGLTPGKHDHVDMVLASGVCLRYTDPRRFGSVLWVEGDVFEHRLLKHLGPEPLVRQFNARYLLTRALGRKVLIKVLLMDSRVVVGVGNIYANEALFLAGIDPRMRCGDLTAESSKQLVKAVKQVLRRAIEAGGTTLKDFVNSEGKPGYFQQKLYVYGRGGEACRRCGGLIEHFKLGQRSTYCCGNCQDV